MSLKEAMGKTALELTVTDVAKIAIVLGVSRIALNATASVALMRIRRKHPELAKEVRNSLITK